MRAKRIPMQWRAPPPKGKYAYSGRSSPSSAHRSGRNAAGVSHQRSSRWTTHCEQYTDDPAGAGVGVRETRFRGGRRPTPVRSTWSGPAGGGTSRSCCGRWIASVDRPALACWGAEDHHFSPSQGRRLVDTVERDTLSVVDRGHHWIVWHRADLVAERVREWIETAAPP